MLIADDIELYTGEVSRRIAGKPQVLSILKPYGPIFMYKSKSKIANSRISRCKGFTLLELMITVAIIGILASIAYPSYVDMIARNHRAAAQTELVRIANLQEQYFLDLRTYTADMTQLGLGGDPFVTDNGFYSIDAVLVGDGFTLTATALGSQATRDPNCTAITVTDLGQKAPSECWSE